MIQDLAHLPAPVRAFGHTAEPFAVYVHWPFCQSKCPYCDFNSHVRFAPPDQARFVAAFEREIVATRALTGPRVTASVFFGGGTPSLMAPATVAAIMAAIDRAWPLGIDCEVTLEANPTSVEAERFRGYRAAGVTRVSLGVQSLLDADLKSLGRLHSAAEARAAIDIAAATFDRFSFDLIYARPQQTEGAWETELGQAIAIARGHLSLYQLTIEPETPFAALHANGRLVIPDDDLADRFYTLTDAMTRDAGLPAYEISNYASPGDEGRHNLVYWRYGEYAGVGPGAHGRVVIGGTRHATSAEKSPEAWLAAVEQTGSGTKSSEALTPAEEVDEALLMGLRLSEGLDLARLARLGGGMPSADAIGHLRDIGMLEAATDGRRLTASRRGRFVLNAIVAKLAASIG